MKYALRPIYQQITKKYHKDDHKFVWFHQDQASSHFSAKTVRNLTKLQEKYGIKFIPKRDIPVKGPDISPMDFCLWTVKTSALETST
jgi:hypothetical protein